MIIRGSGTGVGVGTGTGVGCGGREFNLVDQCKLIHCWYRFISLCMLRVRGCIRVVSGTTGTGHYRCFRQAYG